MKGFKVLKQVITLQQRKDLLELIRVQNLNQENNSNFYTNSKGTQVDKTKVSLMGELTARLEKEMNLKLTEDTIYVREYLNGGDLKIHTDRENLDLTLTIQLENTFSGSQALMAIGYDKSINTVVLEDGDGMVIKGRDLPHYRSDMPKEDGKMTCIFFHWRIDSLEYIDIPFIDKDIARGIIDNNLDTLQPIRVLQNHVAVYDTKVRSGNVTYLKNIEWMSEQVKKHIGNLRLEGWQMLEYSEGDKFTPHYDNGNGVNKRLFTVIVYLNDDFKGGETKFPNIGLEVKPKAGNLLIFKNLNVTNKNNIISDVKSLHEGSPVREGKKYVLVNWALLNEV